MTASVGPHGQQAELPTIEVALSTFNATWLELSAAASLLDDRGIAGLWIMDHFSGDVHGRASVLECWSVLAGLAHVTSDCRIGSLVTNASVRRPVVVAQTAATIQQQSCGRLVLGVGAGGGAPGTAYASEVESVGVQNGSAAERRVGLTEMITGVKQSWTGALADGSRGFLKPDPAPPIIVGGYGPRVASIAGRYGDGFNTSAENPNLIQVINTAMAAHAARADGSGFEISSFTTTDPKWLDPDSGELQKLRTAGVDTVQIIVGAPFDAQVLDSIATCAGLE